MSASENLGSQFPAGGTDEHGGDLPRKEGSTTSYPALGCNHCPASFFSEQRHNTHMKTAHADKPRAVAWQSGEHKIEYHPNLTRQHPHFFLMSEAESGKPVSNMALDHEGKVLAVETHPKQRRQGLATKLWNEVQQHSQETPGVPEPKHSPTRTRAGEAWAKKVGGEVPPRGGNLLSARQMRGMIDFNRS
jgi:hypothetical protein